MKKLTLVVNGMVGSAVLVLAMATGIILFLMFSTEEGEFGRKEGLFGSVFFESEDRGGGVVGATMGLGNPLPLAIVFAMAFLLMCVFQVALNRLRRGKRSR